MINHSKLKYSIDFNSSLNYAASGVYTSSWFDTQSNGLQILWDEYVATQVVPTDASISYEFRTSDTMSTGAVWTTSLAAASGRYVQFKSTLGKKEAGTSPALQKIELKPNAKGQENTTNLIQNSSTSDGFEHWSYTVGGGDMSKKIVEDGVVSKKCIEFSYTTFTTWGVAMNRYYAYAGAAPFNTNKTYTLSFWIKRVSGSAQNISIDIRKSDGTNAVLAGQSISGSSITSDWTRFSFTFVPLVVGSNPNIRFNFTVNSPCTIRIDGLQLEERAFMSEYTEGSRLAKTITIEESSTNLAGYSQEFDNAYWTKVQSSVTANAVVAPDGTLTADAFFDNATTNAHYITKSGIITTGVVTTISVYAKANGKDYLCIDFSSSALRNWFNLSDGTLGVISASCTASIKHVGNGWYRCVATCTSPTSTAFNLLVCDVNSIITYTGDGTKGIYIWGVQVEQKAYPTSYIPTTSASVTRNAESMTISNPLRPDRGTFIIRVYVDGDKIKAAPANNYYLFGCRSSSSNADLFAGKLAPITNAIQFYYAGSSQSVSWTNTPTEGWYVYGFRWDSTEVSIWCNGVKRSLRATPTLLTDLNETLFIGSLDTAVYQWNGSIDHFYAFREALSDSEMATYTSLT